jgi:hypothetical protein
MFAITSQPPTKDRIAEMMPAAECRRCSLREPAWIVLDEYNVSLASSPRDFESLQPVGRLSASFVKSLAETAVLAARSGRARGVLRN